MLGEMSDTVEVELSGSNYSVLRLVTSFSQLSCVVLKCKALMISFQRHGGEVSSYLTSPWEF
jgi:hypothetical protein